VPGEEALEAFYADKRYHNVVSLVVAHRGRLVLEAYARDTADRFLPRHVQSVTKSVTSLVFGITRDQGHFSDLEQRLHEIIPEAFPADTAKRRIRVRHLLTMRSGINFDNVPFATELLINRPRDQAAYILRKPLYAMPGHSFRYRDADPQLLSYAVQRATGWTLDALAAEHLLRPLGSPTTCGSETLTGRRWRRTACSSGRAISLASASSFDAAAYGTAAGLSRGSGSTHRPRHRRLPETGPDRMGSTGGSSRRSAGFWPMARAATSSSCCYSLSPGARTLPTDRDGDPPTVISRRCPRAGDLRERGHRDRCPRGLIRMAVDEAGRLHGGGGVIARGPEAPAAPS
jgi:CubicO group peptidase (beta-lactamase class C family)